MNVDGKISRESSEGHSVFPFDSIFVLKYI